MFQRPFDSALGPGEAFFNKGSLTNFYLSDPKATASGRRYNIGIWELFLFPGAKDEGQAHAIIEAACEKLRPFLDQLDRLESQSLAILNALDWPQDIPLEGQQLVLRSSYGVPDAHRPSPCPAVFSLYGGGHLSFAVDRDGKVTAQFDRPYLDRVFEAAQWDARIAALPDLAHPEFGRIERDILVPLKRRRVGSRFVAIDLYLPDAEIEGFDPAELDRFVPLRRDLGTLTDNVAPALAPLCDDWVFNWLDPANETVSGPFHAAFPKARTDGIAPADFVKALTLDRVCLQPRGADQPRAVWDFRLLEPDEDNTIFVARTTPDGGTILEVTTES